MPNFNLCNLNCFPIFSSLFIFFKYSVSILIINCKKYSHVFFFYYNETYYYYLINLIIINFKYLHLRFIKNIKNKFKIY